MENATISGLLKASPFEGNFLGLRMFLFVFLQQFSAEYRILLKATVHHNILKKMHIFSATGDVSTNCKKLIYQASQEACVQFLNN